MREIGTCRRANFYRPKKYHRPPVWPPKALEINQPAYYAGYIFDHPSRSVGAERAKYDFLQFSLHPADVTPESIAFHIDLENTHSPQYPGEIIDLKRLGGQSGGPVYRRPDEPFGTFELVGFVYEFSEGLNLLLARPIRYITTKGKISPLR